MKTSMFDSIFKHSHAKKFGITS